MDDLIINKKFADIREIDIETKNVLRVYCTQSPDQFKFQIRVKDSLNSNGKGKQRYLIANVDLSISEVEQILEYMKQEKTLYDSIINKA